MTHTISIEKTIEHLVTKPIFTPKIKKQASLPWQLKAVRLAFGTLGRVFPKKAGEIAFKFFGTPRFRARHKTSDELIDSALVSDLQIGTNTIKTYEWGQGERTILLAHGWESRATALRAYIPKLLTAGFKVKAFDGPAHGDSSGRQANLRTFSNVVKTILEQDTSIYGIVAHSFGGPASFFAFSNMPTFSIPKMVMVACPSAIMVPVQLAIDLMNLPKSVANQFIKRLEFEVGLPINEVSIPNFAEQVDIDNILIIHDIHDEVVPIDSAIAHSKSFPQSQLITTEGLGHNLILKDRLVIERVAEFMAG